MIRPCSKHSAEITSNLQRKGMWKLVRPELAQQRTQLWLEGLAQPSDIDPLVITLLELAKKGRESLGDWLDAPGAEYCVLCQIEKAYQLYTIGSEWIDNCTDAVLTVCYVNGILKPS